MKRFLYTAIGSVMAAALAVSVSAAYTDYTERPAFEVQKIANDVTWTPDGVLSPGEYSLIETKNSWMSACVAQNADLDVAKNLDYTLAMSWDQEYVYTFIQFEDDNGHDSLWASDPDSMWFSGSMQIGFTEAGNTGSQRLEYGIALASDTGNLYHKVWANCREPGYEISEGDFTIINDNDILTYEFRTPIDAFSGSSARNGVQYGFSFVIGWGNGEDYIHTQLGAGISGDNGKDCSHFANITLVDPNPPQIYDAYEDCAEPDVRFDVQKIAADVTWAPDGIFTAGEYSIIETNAAWMSAYVQDWEQSAVAQKMDTALNLPYTLAMSWDNEYVYTYLQYTDPNGHVNGWEADPASMWMGSSLQMNFSEIGETGDARLEYGIARTSDTDAMISHVWADYLASGYVFRDTDYIVTNNNDTLTYECRTPISAFSRITPRDEVQYGFNFVISWGNDDLLAHTQLSAGCTGEPLKNASRFARITLQEPDSGNNFGYAFDRYQDSAVRDIEFTVQKIGQDVAWNPDGILSEGEYTVIETNPDWISAAVANSENMEAARNLNYTLAMSWDRNYIYTYIRYEDANGHSNLWENDTGSMWLSGCVQAGFSEAGEVGYKSLEYGIGVTSDSNAQISVVWSDYMDSKFKPSAGDYKVTCEGNVLVYEYRTPVSAFSHVSPRNGARYGMSFVLSWGNGNQQDFDYIQTALGAGITGTPGKDASRYAKITLEGPDDPIAPPFEPYEDCANPNVRFEIQKIADGTTWNPDGILAAGEYSIIDVNPAWISAYAPDQATMQTAKNLEYTLAMSWDKDYIYTYVQYTDPNGHDNHWDEVPADMWQSGALQMNFSDVYSSGEDRLEYGIGLSSDTNNILSTVWSDYLGVDYQVGAEDVFISCENDVLTYECRTPISAFSDITGRHGAQYGFCFVISWGNGGDFIHTQLAAGCTGNPGKDAGRFADITLVDAAVANRVLQGTPVVDGLLDPLYTDSASHTLKNPAFYSWTGEDQYVDVYATSHFLWDNDYLYICTEVRDLDLIDVGADTYAANPTHWRADAVEVWLNEGSGKYKIHADAFGHAFFAQAGDGTPSFQTSGLPVAVQRTDDGYVVEYALPLAQLGVGETVDFSLQVNDVTSLEDQTIAGYSSGSQMTENTLTMSGDLAVVPSEPEGPSVRALTLLQDVSCDMRELENGVKILFGLYTEDGSNQVSTIKSFFEAADYIRVLHTDGSNLDDSVRAGTGAQVCLVDENGAILDSARIVVTGDVDGEGNTDAGDRMRLANYLAGYKDVQLDSLAQEAGDVTGDRMVTPKDRMILARYVAEWSQYRTLRDFWTVE